MSIKHAIIPVAGYGTRRLPISKAVEKCMLPVLNRPVIDYSIQDCIKAGIEHMIIVVSEQQGDQFRHYYDRDENLEKYLQEKGRPDYLQMIQPPAGVTFEFVVQPVEAPYGTATPVALARHLVPAGAQAVVLMGDDFVYGENGTNPIADLIHHAGDGVAVLTTEIDRADVSHYGVLATDEQGNLSHIVERPSPEDAPSTMINISKYVLNSELLDEVVAFYKEPPVPGHEKYITTEPFSRFIAKGGRAKVVVASGTYLDTGTVEKWLQANIHIAKAEGLLNTA